jgi:Dolichyl-phosphate-mannose-protein mannosyltransferase
MFARAVGDSRVTRVMARTAAIPGIALLLALAGLVLRVTLVFATPNYDPKFDAAEYDYHATSIAAGDGFQNSVIPSGDPGPTAFRPPLTSLVLAVVYKLTPGTLTPGRLFLALLGALSVLLVFLVADRVWDRRTAIAAGALAAVFPPLVMLSGSLNAESPFIPLELGLVLALLAYGRSGGELRWAALAGVLCGLCALTRSNGFLLLIPVLMAVVGVHGRAALRPAVRPAAVAAAATLLVIVPWTVRNAIVMDEFIPITDTFGYGLAGTYNDLVRADDEAKGAWRPPELNPDNRDVFTRPGWGEYEVDRQLGEEAREYIRDNPGYAIEAPLLNAYRLLHPKASDQQESISYEEMAIPPGLRDVVTWSYYLLALLAVAGIVVGVRQRRAGPLWMWAIPILIALSTVVLSGAPRYRATIDPFLVMLAGLAIAAALGKAAARERLEDAEAVP